MAYMAQDGKAFGNREMGKHYDSTRPKAKPPSSEGQEREEAEPDMDQVVSEHGPAEHMEIHSHHGDGHVHKSKHHDSHSAHQHVAKAFGEEPQEQESPMGEQSEPMAIPGMRG